MRLRVLYMEESSMFSVLENLVEVIYLEGNFERPVNIPKVEVVTYHYWKVQPPTSNGYLGNFHFGSVC